MLATMRAPTTLCLLAPLALGACAGRATPSVEPTDQPAPEPAAPGPAPEDDGAAEPEPEPEPEPAEVRDDAELQEQAIAAVIRERLPELQGCYEQELRKDQSLAGKMLYTIIIAPDGTVSEVRIDEDGVGSEPVRTCVSEMIGAWSFVDVEVSEPTEVGFAVKYVADRSD
jgi:hypothetical protein